MDCGNRWPLIFIFGWLSTNENSLDHLQRLFLLLFDLIFSSWTCQRLELIFKKKLISCSMTQVGWKEPLEFSSLLNWPNIFIRGYFLYLFCLGGWGRKWVSLRPLIIFFLNGMQFFNVLYDQSEKNLHHPPVQGGRETDTWKKQEQIIEALTVPFIFIMRPTIMFCNFSAWFHHCWWRGFSINMLSILKWKQKYMIGFFSFLWKFWIHSKII